MPLAAFEIANESIIQFAQNGLEDSAIAKFSP
jgi:hypothetical protein